MSLTVLPGKASFAIRIGEGLLGWWINSERPQLIVIYAILGSDPARFFLCLSFFSKRDDRIEVVVIGCVSKQFVSC